MNRATKCLLLISLFLFGGSTLQAQDVDYLLHGKTFNYCWYKQDCRECYTCNKIRYEIKIENNVDKKIKSVHYKYYSSVYNHIIEKEAKIEADIIAGMQTGLLYICVPDITHWAISKIVYEDNSTATFIVHGHLDSFQQEPDECDCN